MNTTGELPIKLVVATQLSQERFFAESLTAVSMRANLHASPVELRLYSDNSMGLSEVYNDAIEASIEEDAILVFAHDDVLISDYFWAERVRAGLEDFELLGVVGNTRRSPKQAGWIMLDKLGTLDEFEHLSGAIGQGSSFPPEKLDHFGTPGLECKLLDGVFLAISTATLRTSKLRFDPQFRFHFYDLDLCRSAEILNIKMGTMPLSLVHKSWGNLDQEWLSAYQNYLHKWGEAQ